LRSRARNREIETYGTKIQSNILYSYLEMLALETRANALEDGHTHALEVQLVYHVEQFLDLIEEQHLLWAVAHRPHSQQQLEYLAIA
jgi:hypothetical protein